MSETVTDEQAMPWAGIELCEELFKLSGWDGTRDAWMPERESVKKTRSGNEYRKYPRLPAYDLSYLLRKFIGRGGLEIRCGDKGCIATSQIYSFAADTPEDAVCKLAIELFKQGILK